MHSETLGYILRLPRILKPLFTSLYLLTFTDQLIKDNVQYNLLKHAVVINGTLKIIVVSNCTAWGIYNYLCSA